MEVTREERCLKMIAPKIQGGGGGGDARAPVLNTTDHEEIDECWMIEDEIREKGIHVELVSSVISTVY